MISEIQKDFSERHGLSSRHILEFLLQVERSSLEVNSFILLQNGKATAQFYRNPYRKNSPQLLFSLSKSFTSIAVGIARDEGFLDLSDKVISFFPDKVPDHISENLSYMTVHHLLSMNAGHHDNIYGYVEKETDWVKAFLSLEIEHKPGTYYRYSTHSTYMLAAILEKVTGQNLTEFLTPRLFEPLGISNPSWETCPLGITAGGMGLSIPTEGIAKFGQMLLNKGMYNGQRIVSEAYINLATKEQSDTRRGEDRIDFAQGYGYQFFLCREGCFMGNGGYGQLCFVAPKANIVIAATSNFSSMRQLQTLLHLIYEHLLGQIGTEIAEDDEGQKLLHTHLSSIAYPFTKPETLSATVFNIDNRHYSLKENDQHISQLGFFYRDEKLEFQITYEDKTVKSYLFNFDDLMYSSDLFTKDLATHQQELITHTCWKDANLLELTLLYIETPYVVKYSISFNDRRIELHYTSNLFNEFIQTGYLF
ncbi:serine hydrolase domain-containing protein [Paenibacillus eucommiae]|uniref:CubicO group peptidase (Beta-lactamase class C family) n=1 Tax=Paenibacillus eucommiae TaxID=1355755 RepID=A0ABS4IR37_9BACL|nr:serine hydrolase [Paenibacillus eucommiae]MBP1990034.1 CubicO group peptidase (beta-lactamase class C family) [Paenibacillus eucommiae]